MARARGFAEAIERPALAKLMLLERFAPAAYDDLVRALAGRPDGKLPELAALETPDAKAKTPEGPMPDFSHASR